jgi:hypothetical protein
MNHCKVRVRLYPSDNALRLCLFHATLVATQVHYNNIAQACHPVLLIDDPPP